MVDDPDRRNDAWPDAADQPAPPLAAPRYTQPYPGAPPQPVGAPNRAAGPGVAPATPSPEGAPPSYGPSHFRPAPVAAGPPSIHSPNYGPPADAQYGSAAPHAQYAVGQYAGGQYPGPAGVSAGQYPGAAAVPAGQYPRASAGQYPGVPSGAYVGAAPRDPRPRGLAIAALCVAIGGSLIIWIPLIGALALLTALVLGIVVLARKDQGGTGFGVAAVIISAISGLVAIVISLFSLGLWAAAWPPEILTYPDWSSPYTSEPVPPVEDGPGPPTPAEPVDVTGGGLGTAAAPYAYGDTARIADGVTGSMVWDIEVGAPLDRTAELADEEELYNPLPENGAYVAFEVTLTYAGEGTVDPFIDYEWAPALTWTDAQGVEHEEAYVWFEGDELSLLDVGELATGESATVTYVVDAPSDLVGSATISIGYSPDLRLRWANPS